MKEIVVPILNNEYKVIVCWGDGKAIKSVLKEWGYPIGFDLEAELINMRGRTFGHAGCHPVIALPSRPKTPEQIGTLAHEAVHAIKGIFEMIQEQSVDEVFAHSVGAVVREVLKKVR